MDIWNFIILNFLVISIIFLSFLLILKIWGKKIIEKYFKEDIYKKLESLNIASFDKISKINAENLRLKKQRIELISVRRGSKGLLFGYPLTYKENNKSFKVNYEVEVLEATPDRIKVSAYDYTSNDSIANEPGSRNGIINFMKERWINRSEFQLMVDDSMVREDKIDMLMN
jgi:hypothetical protein